MLALSLNPASQGTTPLNSWLRHAHAATEGGVEDRDALSKRNVAAQIENLRSHPMVREREASGDLALHGIWFHIRNAEVHYLEKAPDGFVLIDDVEGEKILKKLDGA